MDIGRLDFIDAVTRLGQSVYSFHDRFDIPTVDISKEDDTLEILRRRLALLAEEVGEHSRELNRANLEAATSEAIDIAYIALGTILTLGYSGQEACHIVASKNDAKTLSTHGRRRSTGKIIPQHPEKEN